MVEEGRPVSEGAYSFIKNVYLFKISDKYVELDVIFD
ncbi:hypothetical protein NIES4071_40630 [Calothrix sp. NIES-4071]|nr:hypothetical protein NIES4071_40630 [Calothrix sp. NIES-4071]BAZ58379.1 hypothetical protein NIES4105_40570 [Calothrix sp. NIES-4105]